MATNRKPKNQSRHANAHMKLYRDMRGKQARAFKGELLPSGHSPKPETLFKRLTKSAIKRGHENDIAKRNQHTN